MVHFGNVHPIAPSLFQIGNGSLARIINYDFVANEMLLKNDFGLTLLTMHAANF